MNKIVLFRTSVAWYARYEGPHAAFVQQLFETDVLPTAFTADADRKIVQEEIAARNPGVQVSIETHPRREAR